MHPLYFQKIKTESLPNFTEDDPKAFFSSPEAKNDFKTSSIKTSDFPEDPRGILSNPHLHPVLREKITSLIYKSREKGLSIRIISGYRSFAEQDLLYKRGSVTKARGGQSYHNYGLAVDVALIDKNGKISWNPHLPWDEVGKIGETIGLKWGGRFRTLVDKGHFALEPEIPLRELKKIYEAGGLKKVWDKIN